MLGISDYFMRQIITKEHEVRKSRLYRPQDGKVQGGGRELLDAFPCYALKAFVYSYSCPRFFTRIHGMLSSRAILLFSKSNDPTKFRFCRQAKISVHFSPILKKIVNRKFKIERGVLITLRVSSISNSRLVAKVQKGLMYRSHSASLLLLFR